VAKPGPKVPWQRRARYLRARCVERLKPNQIEELGVAYAFARWLGVPLNTCLTIRFPAGADCPSCFRRGQDVLAKRFRRAGYSLHWVYVWEAKGGEHVHCLAHVPKPLARAFPAMLADAYPGCDVHCERSRSPAEALSYITKGTDVVTRAKFQGRRGHPARRQGIIPWKRCGSTQNLGRAARRKAGLSTP
jgi:hypothetical protein